MCHKGRAVELTQALWNGETEKIDHYLNLTSRPGLNRRCALHLAAFLGNEDAVNKILAKGANVFQPVSVKAARYLPGLGSEFRKKGPLALAVAAGNVAIIRKLIKEGRRFVSHFTKHAAFQEQGVFLIAASSGNLGVVKLLLQCGISADKRGLAVRKSLGHIEITRFLLKQGFYPRKCLTLSLATFDLLSLILILEYKPATSNSLIFSINRKCGVKTVELLLDKGAPLNVSFRINKTRIRYPLELAMETKQVEVVKLLLARGAQPNNYVSLSPLSMAVRNRDHTLVLLLLEHGANSHAEHSSMSSFEHAKYIEDTVSLRLMLAHGANPNDSSWKFNTNYTVVKLLLEAGMQVNSDVPLLSMIYFNRLTPSCGSLDIFQLICAFGFDAKGEFMHDDENITKCINSATIGVARTNLISDLKRIWHETRRVAAKKILAAANHIYYRPGGQGMINAMNDFYTLAASQ